MFLNLSVFWPTSERLHAQRAPLLARWVMLVCLLFPTLTFAQTSKDGKDDKDDPLTALPTTYSDILLETSPSGLPVALTQDNKPLSCLPANVTPCKFRVVAYKKVDLWIAVLYRNQSLRYHRPLKGRTRGVQHWLLPMPLPTAILPTTQPTTQPVIHPDAHSANLPPSRTPPFAASRPSEHLNIPVERRISETPVERRISETPVERRIPETPVERRISETPVERRLVAQRPASPPAVKHATSAPLWPWFVVGGVIVVGISVGIGVGIAQQDRIVLRCSACQK